MSFTINTNLASINAQRHLGLNNSTLSTAMQRLSSGMRINSAKDDAAGLAISERMQAQVRGMSQAARNANDGISMLQTAEGASSKVNDMLQRMRELAVQSINFTNSDNDRKALNAEVLQLKAEIDRIGMTSKFNGAAVFDTTRKAATPIFVGSPTQGSSTTLGSSALELMDKLKNGWMSQVEQVVYEGYGLRARNNMTLKIDLTSFTDGPWNTGARVLSTWMVPSGGTGSGPSTSLTLEIDMEDYKVYSTNDFLDLLAHEMVHAIMGTGQSWAEIGSGAPGNQEINKWFTEGVAEYIYGADTRLQRVTVDNAITDDLQTWNGDDKNYAAAYLSVRVLDTWLKGIRPTGNGVKDVLSAIHNNAGQTLDSAIKSASGDNQKGVDYFLQTVWTNYKSNAAAGTITLDGQTFNINLNLNNDDSGSIRGSDVNSSNPSLSGAATSQPLQAASSNNMSNFVAYWEGDSTGSAPTEGVPPTGSTVTTAHASLGNILGFQVGADAGQFVYARIGGINLDALGIKPLNVATANDATTALGQLDAAIDYVSSLRGELGAQMNRFEAVIATLDVMVENTSASRGRIVDADFAIETANLSRTQILQQAGTAMVSQANQLPQNVLSLLR